MRRTLLGTITERAEETFGREVTAANFDEWANHWLATAEAYRDEFLRDGLPQTAEKVQEHINFQQDARGRTK